MSRIALFVISAFVFCGDAVADGAVEGAVFRHGDGVPWSQATLRLEDPSGAAIAVPVDADATFAVALKAGQWILIAVGPSAAELGRWPVVVVDDQVSEALLTLDPQGGQSTALFLREK